MKKYFSFLLSFSLILVSCQDKKEEFDYGYDFYPSSIGEFWIYDVLQTNWVTGIPTRDTFQIKEVITEQFTINGEPRFRLERYKRDSETSAWPATPDSVWSVSINTQRILRVENNIRYVKLIFPVENGRSWNGNLENNLGYDSYTLRNVGNTFKAKNNKSYGNTATVIQEVDTSNIVDRDYRFEVYAKNIGLVYRSKEIHQYDQSTLGTKTIESGISYYESLNTYGKQ